MIRLRLLRAAQRVVQAINPDFDQPDWRPILRKSAETWSRALEAARGGPRVLIPTAVGGHLPSTTLESLLAVALTLRGADVQLLLCDEQLPACLRSHVTAVASDEAFVVEGPQASGCIRCYSSGAPMYRTLGLRVRTLGALLTDRARTDARELAAGMPADAIPSYTLDGLAVGEHALAGTLRFYARGTLPGGASEAVFRRYLHAGLLTAFATRQLLAEAPFEASCFNHGIYIPHGVIGEAAREAGVRVVNWNPAYRIQSFIFSHGDTYHHTLMDEPTSAWENLPWSDEREAELMSYLRSRWQGSRDWITFNANPEERTSAIAQEIGIDFSKPTIGLLTNVIWDAQLHYRANAFPNMMDWLVRTIAYFRDRPDVQLLIRVHPAEITGAVPSRQPVLDEIRAHFPTLPSNVYVIPPESSISTYVTMMRCNTVIIYGTKTGVELTSEGVPVIVCGEAWIRNKGLTADARTPEEYYALLDLLPGPGRLPPETVARARRYAYHFFFRRMIPMTSIAPATGIAARQVKYQVGVSTLEQLLPGRDPGLDVICDGILQGTPFTYPAETLA
ncbi:MAG: capsule biosynthesis protein [Gemmatimonadaceae bacterium]